MTGEDALSPGRAICKFITGIPGEGDGAGDRCPPAPIYLPGAPPSTPIAYLGRDRAPAARPQTAGPRCPCSWRTAVRCLTGGGRGGAGVEATGICPFPVTLREAVLGGDETKDDFCRESGLGLSLQQEKAVASVWGWVCPGGWPLLKTWPGRRGSGVGR